MNKKQFIIYINLPLKIISMEETSENVVFTLDFKDAKRKLDLLYNSNELELNINSEARKGFIEVLQNGK